MLCAAGLVLSVLLAVPRTLAPDRGGFWRHNSLTVRDVTSYNTILQYHGSQYPPLYSYTLLCFFIQMMTTFSKFNSNSIENI